METTRNAILPLYVRIAEELRAEILALPSGAQIEPEQDLVRRFGASRGTIRQAIETLVREGLIVREKGRGSFRASPSDEDVYRLNGVSSRTVRAFGVRSKVSGLTSTLVRAAAPLADELQIPHGSRVRKIERVRTIDGQLFVSGVAYVRADVLPKFPKEQFRTSLLDLLQETYRLHLCDRVCVCSAVPADGEDAAKLSVPEGTPLLEARLTCSAVGKGPVMIDTFHFRPDFRLQLEIGKPVRITE